MTRRRLVANTVAALTGIAVGILFLLLLYTPPVRGAIPTGECWAPTSNGQRVHEVKPYHRRGDCVRLLWASVAATCERFEDDADKRAQCYEQAPPTVRCEPAPCGEPL